MVKSITLCADDFGIAPHISQSILTLAQNRRISAISCMTTCADWKHHGKELKDFHQHLDIGLHFNLTHGEEDYFREIKYWLLSALSRQIDKIFIENKLNEQIDKFIDVTGFLPDFIDGHQHIHAFPMIRDVLIKVMKARFKKNTPYTRSISSILSTPESRHKALILRIVSLGFDKTLDNHSIKRNTKFGGVYSLKDQKPYREYMIRWLQQAPSHTLIMCHPGLDSNNTFHDPHPLARLSEYHYFLSQAFQEDCKESGVILSRLS